MCNLIQMELWGDSFETNGSLDLNGKWAMLKIEQSEFRNILQNVQLPHYEGLIQITASPHISVIKNERPNKKKDEFEKMHGRKYAVMIDPEVHTNGRHLFCYAESRGLCDLRRSLNLPTLFDHDSKEFKVKFHITLGKFVVPINHNQQVGKAKIGDHISLQDGYLHL